MTVQTRRRATLTITPDFLVELLKEPGDRPRAHTVISGALPADAKLIACMPAPWQFADPAKLALVIESASFAPVPMNQHCPELPSPHIRVEIDACAVMNLRQSDPGETVYDMTRARFGELMEAAYRDVVDVRSYIPNRIQQLTEALWRRLRGDK